MPANQSTTRTSAGRAAAGQTSAVRPAEAADLPAILSLLEAADLPTEGVDADGIRIFVAGEDGRLVGVAGLEPHGPYGLLRSVVVDSSVRGRGVGAALTRAVVDAARAEGLVALYALTTTAERYFPRLGFTVIERAAVPAPVQSSDEFRTICPASAVALALEL